MNQELSVPGLFRLLHVEDNKNDAELIHAVLKSEWPECKIKLVETREDFLHALENERFDLILSDFSLPVFDGLSALDLAREYASETPFIFLSGTIGEDNAVRAMQNGAMDYVIKDRSARLIPAIRRALEQCHEQKLRHQAEERLHEQAELLNKANDAIFVSDLEGRITYWNRSAARLFGWDKDDTREKDLKELFGHYNPGLLKEAVKQVKDSGLWDGELRYGGSDETLRYLENRWTLMSDAANQPKSILHFVIDITEQKELEARLLRTQRMEGIGTLAGGIAHDLNNILAPILMSTNLLQQKLDDENTQRLLGIIEKSTNHGADLLRQVLAFSRGADGERSSLEPKGIIRDVVSLLGETLPRSIEIETFLGPDLKPVLANATQLNQVLINLGVNARDAMPEGGYLKFRAENVLVDQAQADSNPGCEPGDYIRFEAVDNGTGMSPEVMERIFDPFFTTKKIGKGTGLGLSTTIGIVKSHGGFMEVRSTLGEGTTFSIYLPSAEAEGEKESESGSKEPWQSDGNGTILVVDDEESIQLTTSAILQDAGFSVHVAGDGAAGVELFREHADEICVVLTDLNMPGLQGTEVIRQLRSINPDVQIIAMSGMTDEPSADCGTGKKIHFLAKPMTGVQLIRAVKKALADS